jgi:integrase
LAAACTAADFNGGPKKYGGITEIEEMRANLRMNCLPESLIDEDVSISCGSIPVQKLAGSEAGEDETRKAFSTQTTYQGYLKKWILPRWRSYRLADVKAVQVEQWLKSLLVSRGTKSKIRNIMSALYSHAQRWEWTTSNPIKHVRQSAKRSRVPIVLTPEQVKDFLAKLEDPAKTAVLLGALTGLRGGELLGLKWSDIDFEKLEINVIRDVVKQRIERCKTEASKKAIPIDAELAETLWSRRLRCPYNQPNDWVFASPRQKGRQPYWPGSLFRIALQPALKAAGIAGPSRRSRSFSGTPTTR